MRTKNIMLPGRLCWAAMRECGHSVQKWFSNRVKKFSRKKGKDARTKNLCIFIKVEQLNAILGNNPEIHKS